MLLPVVSSPPVQVQRLQQQVQALVQSLVAAMVANCLRLRATLPGLVVETYLQHVVQVLSLADLVARAHQAAGQVRYAGGEGGGHRVRAPPWGVWSCTCLWRTYFVGSGSSVVACSTDEPSTFRHRQPAVDCQ